MCIKESYALFSDAAGTVPWTDPKVYFDTTVAGLNTFNIYIDSSSYFTRKTAFLFVTSTGMVRAKKEIWMETCGGETIVV
jgi:hypothetical protein